MCQPRTMSGKSCQGEQQNKTIITNKRGLKQGHSSWYSSELAIVVQRQMTDATTISWRDQLIFNEMMMMMKSALYQSSTLRVWIVI